MGSLTIKELPAEVVAALKARASERGVSVSRYVLEYLEREIGADARGPKRGNAGAKRTVANAKGRA